MLKTSKATLSTKKLDSYKPRASGAGLAVGDQHALGNSGLVLNHTQANTATINAHIAKKKLKNGTSLKLSYDKKLTIYGNTYEIITYNQTQYISDPSNRNDYNQTPTKRRADSLWRTRNNVCRLIIANVDTNPLYQPVFATLTFKKNITDTKTAHRHFKYFITKLSTYLNYRTKYISVVEFQKRGAIHYHIVFFNLPFIDKQSFSSLWSHGFTNLRTVDKIKNVSKYVGKYMSKELLDPRLVGQKAYFTSKNLSRPVTYYNESNIDNLLKDVTLQTQEIITHPDYTITKKRL